MSDKITVEIPLERAKKFMADYPEVAAAIKAALPVPPEYEDGTLAKVSFADGYSAFLRWENGQWRGAANGAVFGTPTSVEVIPVLKDGEIAVPRPVIHSIVLRNAARRLRDNYYLTTGDWLDGVADTMEKAGR